MAESVVDALIKAIENRRSVEFVYDGFLRRCSPHIVGQKLGNVNVLVYQYAGSTSKGDVTLLGPENWRCMHVTKIDRVLVVDDEWYTWDNYEENRCIDEVWCRV